MAFEIFPSSDWVTKFLLSKIEIHPNGCWLWHGTKSCRYGVVTVGRWPQQRGFHVHRMLWMYRNGSFPGKLEADHLCNNRGCVNPEHIEPVTHSENIARAYVYLNTFTEEDIT